MSYPNRGTTSSNPLYQTRNLNDTLNILLHERSYDKTRIQRMYQYPANRKEALMHKKANQFGYNSKTLNNGDIAPVCPCCELPINTVRIKMKYGTTPSKDRVKAGKNIFLLNPGSAMFFTFIKMTIAYLFLRFLLTDGFNLITNAFGTNCSSNENQKHCATNIMAKFSTYNKQTTADENMLNVVDILNLVAVVVSIIFFTFYRKYQYRIYSLTDISNNSQAEFSIFVQNIPIFLPENDKKISKNFTNLQFDYQQQLKKLFANELNNWIDGVMKQKGGNERVSKDFYKFILQNPTALNGPRVTSVSLCFDLTEMQKLNQMREQLMKQHNQNINNNIQSDQNSLFYLPNQIECINQQYINLSKKFSVENSSSFNLSHFVGKAFISFQYEYYKEYFLEYLGHKANLQMHEKKLKLSTAAQPSDIFWFNMKISNSTRKISIIYSFLIMFMALLFSFGLLFSLQFYQSTHYQASSKENVILNYLFTIVVTIITVAINFILAIVINILTHWEKHKTNTDFIVSLMIKTVIAQFINTAVIYYIISIAGRYYLSQEQTSPLNSNGLVMDITSLVAVTGILQLVLNLVQPGSIFTKIMNWYKYGNKDEVNMFQIQFNKEIQDPQFDFSLRYAYYIVNVYIVSFYSYITPYIGIILAIIFVGQFWIDKYNLFQRFSSPIDFNYRLSRLTLRSFQCSIFIFALGNFFFSMDIHSIQSQQSYQIINTISLIISGIYCIVIMFLPKRWFEYIEEEQFQKLSYTYCLENNKFKKVYWIVNPATTFAKQVDINNKNRFINYGQNDRFADAKDYDNIIQAQSKGKIKIQQYSAEEENKIIAEAFVSLNLGGILKPDGEENVLDALNNAFGQIK